MTKIRLQRIGKWFVSGVFFLITIFYLVNPVRYFYAWRYPRPERISRNSLVNECQATFKLGATVSLEQCRKLDCDFVSLLPNTMLTNDGRPVLLCETSANVLLLEVKAKLLPGDLSRFHPFSGEGTFRSYYFEETGGGFVQIRTNSELQSRVGPIDTKPKAIEFLLLFADYSADAIAVASIAKESTGYRFRAVPYGDKRCGGGTIDVLLSSEGVVSTDHSTTAVRWHGEISDC